MPRRLLVLAVSAALLAPAGAVPAAAAPTKVGVSGRIRGGGGMTVLALASDGSARGVRLGPSGRFALYLPRSSARGTSLQLVRTSGRYAGPVVLAATGSRSYTALGGKPVKLGDISLRSGYARVRATRLPKGTVDTTRWARGGSGGKPAGAGRLGLSRDPRTTSALATHGGGGRQVLTTGAGADPDRDGVPNPFDADDDGDLTLDGSDQTTAGQAASNAGLFSTLYTEFGEALNANAGDDVTTGQIDELLEGHLNLVFYFGTHRFADPTAVTGANVDCFQLAYCRRGAGTAVLTGLSESADDLPRGSLWTDYSPDGSGLPNLEHLASRGAWAAGVQPLATSAQITPGDTYKVNFRASGTAVTVPTSLSSYFVTTPAISRWAAGEEAADVTYPVAEGTAGGRDNPIQSGDGRLALTFWRPQRLAIAGAETGRLVDMGGLRYGLSLTVEGDAGSEHGCAGHYEELSSLTDEFTGDSDDPADSLFPLRDTAADRAPDPANTMSFTVDLAACLEAAGVDPDGATLQVSLTAAGEAREGGMDRATQSFTVQLG